MKLKISHTAFSLIELMVVIAIVAVLSAIAVPAYKNYLERAKMTAAIKVIEQQLSKWQEVNSTGDWYQWDIADRYPDSPVDYMTIYINWANISFTFAPGYFNREAETYVTYIPMLNGQSIEPLNNAGEIPGDAVVSWACYVGGPGGVYYGGLSVEEFRATYFPKCG